MEKLTESGLPFETVYGPDALADWSPAYSRSTDSTSSRALRASSAPTAAKREPSSRPTFPC